jgi:lipopolysaccharide export system protein LptA
MYKPSLTQAVNFFSQPRSSQVVCFELVAKTIRGLVLRVTLILISTVFATNLVHAYMQTSADEALPIVDEESQSTISNDFRLPVTAISKNQSLDGKKKTSIFIDNVVIRQGSLEILADRVEANATAGNGKEVITAIGNPASYKQRLEDGSIVIASANEIQYKVEFQTISLRGNAVIKQNDVKVNGDYIAFDMAKEQIIASSDANSSESVTTVLSPGAFSTSKKSDEDKQ